jgi:hypothetical protein
VPTQHQMTRTRTLEHAVEEWSCTECSRRLLLRMPPDFEQFVLDRGDEWASHVGGAGGLQPAGMQAHPSHALGPTARERDWLADQGITWDPDGNS